MYKTIALLILLVSIPFLSYAHTDPPIMNLSLNPDMPDQGEESLLKIAMHGSLTGIATTGAKVHIEARHLQTGETLNIPASEKGNGIYIANLVFSQYDMWKMKVSIEHQNELDIREYNIHGMKPIPGYHHVLEDQTVLKMDKNNWGQPIPPFELLKWYGIAIVWLLFGVSILKRKQKPKPKRKRAFTL